MILYDVTWINEYNIEYPIADGLKIWEALEAIKEDIRVYGLKDNGLYKLYEYNEEDEQDIKRIFKFGRI